MLPCWNGQAHRRQKHSLRGVAPGQVAAPCVWTEPSRSERPQNPKKDHPRPPLLETTRVDGVKAPQHRGTPRSYHHLNRSHGRPTSLGSKAPPPATGRTPVWRSAFHKRRANTAGPLLQMLMVKLGPCDRRRPRRRPRSMLEGFALVCTAKGAVVSSSCCSCQTRGGSSHWHLSWRCSWHLPWHVL